MAKPNPNNGDKNILKPTIGDIGYSLTKAALGGGVPELYSMVITPPLTKRFYKWIKSIDERVKKLEKIVDDFSVEKLGKDEMFLTAFMEATNIALRNHDEKKLEALRNAVLNSSLPNSPEENIQLLFLRYVDELTPLHLAILKFFDYPESYLKQKQIPFPVWEKTNPGRILYYAFPKYENERGFLRLIIQDLARKKLLDDSKINTQMMKTAYLRTSHATTFGKQFLRFITSPVKELDDEKNKQ